MRELADIELGAFGRIETCAPQLKLGSSTALRWTCVNQIVKLIENAAQSVFATYLLTMRRRKVG